MAEREQQGRNYEVKSMKHNWTYKFIGDICEILNGFAFKSSEYVEQGIRVIRITNVQKGHIEDENPVYYPYDAEPLLKKYILKENDILMSLTGNVGRVGLLPENMLPAALNQRVACLRLKTEEVYFPFLYHYFNSDFFEQKCIESSRGIAQKNMSTEWLKEQAIPVPPLSIQSRIVSELDLLQSLIDKQKAQHKELDTLAQSIFYDMFGDPVENEKGWEVKKLGDCCNSELGKTLNQSKDTGTLRPYLCAINIQWNKIIKENLKQTQFEDTELERYSVKKGDLLICEGGDIGRAAIWNEDEEIQYQNALHRLRFGKEMIPIFCLYHMKYLKDKGVLDNRYGKGVTIKHLVKSALLSIPFILPPLSLQQSFASKTEAIERQKELINQSIREAQTLFDSRMEYYFGE